MSNPDVAFCRALLYALSMDLQRLDVKVGNRPINVWKGGAWTYRTGRNDWEFHGPDKFYWHGRADNAYDARYKGWMAWLKQDQPEKFKQLDEETV